MGDYAWIVGLLVGAGIGLALSPIANWLVYRVMEWLDEWRRDRDFRRSLFCPDPMRDAKLLNLDVDAGPRDAINASGFKCGVARDDGKIIKQIICHQLTATEWAVIVTYDNPQE